VVIDPQSSSSNFRDRLGALLDGGGNTFGNSLMVWGNFGLTKSSSTQRRILVAVGRSFHEKRGDIKDNS